MYAETIDLTANLALAAVLLAPIVATGLRLAVERAARLAPKERVRVAPTWTDCYGILTPGELYSAVEQPGHSALRAAPVPSDVLAMRASERPTMPASAVAVRSKEGATVASLDAVQVGNMRWHPGTRRWG